MAKCCGQEKYKQGQVKSDRRQQLIDDIKSFIGDLDETERARKRPVKRGDGGAVGIPGLRDMEDECKQYRRRRDCEPPLITSLAIHEIRPTSDYSNKQHENTRQWTYVDATRQDMFDPMPSAPWELPRTPSQELRASTLYQSCDCRRRNGLQHDCPRWDCGGRPTCLAVNPGPCCGPSAARKPVRGDRRYQPVSGERTRQPPCAQARQQPQSQQQQPSPVGQMLCVCSPLQHGNAKQPVMKAATQTQTNPKNQGVTQEIVGFVAMGEMGPIGFVARSPPPPSPQEPKGISGNPADEFACFCKPAGTSVDSPAQGARYMCCPS